MNRQSTKDFLGIREIILDLDKPDNKCLKGVVDGNWREGGRKNRLSVIYLN